MIVRPRRNRKTETIRRLLQEHRFSNADLVAPLFVTSGYKHREEIGSMPGIYRMSVDLILEQALRYQDIGIPAVALFPVIHPSDKDTQGSHALSHTNIMIHAIQQLKHTLPSLCVIADLALDPFTSHGHDGIVDPHGAVLNDPTVDILCTLALHYAQAGVDIVAPSDMMDGRVGRIRTTLDTHGYHTINILSYTAKYASALYSPFREALRSSLQFGDKKTYQLNPANRREALRQASLDVAQGADMIMVKPALFYLDVISQLKQHAHVPICAFHVSGEYAMVMAAHQRGWVDASEVFSESILSIKRAGADFIITYALEYLI